MIVTHTNPDLDAITGVWLLKRFLPSMAGEEVRFVNTGSPDPYHLLVAVAVVDTGRKLDPSNLRFDHHHLPGQEANDTCAAKQVFEHLLRMGKDIEHLQPLIDLVFAGDTGRPEARQSRELGLHAILSGYKSWYREQQDDGQATPDPAVWTYGVQLLDILEVRLRRQAEARAELDDKTVYKSDDGLVWAIRHGSVGSSFAAFDEGARLVIFEGEPLAVEGGTTYPVGIQRANEWQQPHVGQLVDIIREQTTDAGLAEELNSWFKHNSGFFAGRGTAKAPVFEPFTISLEALAMLVDEAWLR